MWARRTLDALVVNRCTPTCARPATATGACRNMVGGGGETATLHNSLEYPIPDLIAYANFDYITVNPRVVLLERKPVGGSNTASQAVRDEALYDPPFPSALLPY